jgi:hypothetical protein
LRQHANEYAKTLAGVVGYKQIRGNIFEGVTGFADTSRTKCVAEPTPYSVCGLGDIDRFVKLNVILQSLRKILRTKVDGLKELYFDRAGADERISRNVRSQSAPVEFTDRPQKVPDPKKPADQKETPNLKKAKLCPSQGLNNESHFDGSASSAVEESVAEAGRNHRIASVNSSSIFNNLKMQRERCGQSFWLGGPGVVRDWQRSTFICQSIECRK